MGHVRRRRFLLTAGALLAMPLASVAQEQGKVGRIGFLSPRREEPSAFRYYEPLRRGLSELGYVEGKTLAIEWRFAGGSEERLLEFAKELVRSKVDIIVTAGSQATRAAQKATTTIPIVMANTANPIGSGFVTSLSRPGGNTTGVTNILEDLGGKYLEFLRSVAPTVSRVAVLVNPTNSSHSAFLKRLQPAAKMMKIQVMLAEAQTVQEIEAAFGKIAHEHVGAVIHISDAFFNQQTRQIVDLTAKQRLASIASYRTYVEAGSLMSYGPNPADSYHRVASYIDKILKGARPGDLPIQQPTKIHLAINLKTARVLGITISKELLFRADEIIE